MLIICRFETNADHSPFLRLPAEVRNAVYQFALSGQTVSSILHRSAATTTSPPLARRVDDASLRRPHRFSLLRVCRQIFIETAVLLYRLSTFRFNDSTNLLLWLNNISAWESVLVQSVELDCALTIDEHERQRWTRCFAQLPQLRSFHVNIYECETWCARAFTGYGGGDCGIRAV